MNDKEFTAQDDDIAAIRSHIQSFFKTESKANEWMVTPNPLLGGLSPTQMIRFGRAHRLRQFIEAAIAENCRPITAWSECDR